MPIYYKPESYTKNPAYAGGTNGDASEGGSQLLDNLLSSVRGARTGQGTVAEVLLQQANHGSSLPSLELTDASSGGAALERLSGSDLSLNKADLLLNKGVKGLIDIASKLADPIGILKIVFEFLIQLFLGTAQIVGEALPQVSMYNRAAQAALDSMKKLKPAI